VVVAAVKERGDALEFIDKKVTSLGGQSCCLVSGAINWQNTALCLGPSKGR